MSTQTTTTSLLAAVACARPVPAVLLPASYTTSAGLAQTLSMLRQFHRRSREREQQSRSRIAARLRTLRRTLRSHHAAHREQVTHRLTQELGQKYEAVVTQSLASARAELVELSLKIARHVVGIELQHSSSSLLARLEAALSDLSAPPIAISLSPQDFERTTALRPPTLPCVAEPSLPSGCATITSAKGDIIIDWVRAFEQIAAALRSETRARLGASTSESLSVQGS